VNPTVVYYKNADAFNSGVRRIVNKGGTSSSKTFSLLELLLTIAMRRVETGVLISIVSETLPHLRKGAIRDYDNILKAEGLTHAFNKNLTSHSYTIGKSVVEFFSADTAGKATGPRRDILLLNECNNIPYKVVSELEQRTSEAIFYDYNPVIPFWIDDHVLTLPSNEFTLITSNYKDNHHLPPSIAHEIELRASRDPNYKRIHIDCEYGIYEGLIFPEVILIDEMPQDATPGYGLDFGFINDPTALVDVRIAGENLYLDQMVYQTGLTAPDIIALLKSFNLGRREIIADSADPRMIEEIRRGGFNIFPAVKGAGSVVHGLDSMKRYKIHLTKRSIDGIKEFRNYQWKIDSSGKKLNEPVDYWNHLIDAARYRVAKITAKPTPAKIKLTYR